MDSPEHSEEALDIRIGQFCLDEESTQKNVAFLEFMTDAPLENRRVLFDKLSSDEPSSQRLPNPDMTIECLKEIASERDWFRLQIALPHHIPLEIRLCYMAREERVEHFIWVLCDFTEENYRILEEGMRQAYGKTVAEMFFP